MVQVQGAVEVRLWCVRECSGEGGLQYACSIACRGSRRGQGGGRSLPPSSGSTQVGTTPRVAFQAMIGADGEENVEGAP
jgi:hypothetical protein